MNGLVTEQQLIRATPLESHGNGSHSNDASHLRLQESNDLPLGWTTLGCYTWVLRAVLL